MPTGHQRKQLLEFVKRQHIGQLRKYTTEPYWTHLVRVSAICEEHIDNELACEVAICHDLLEDTECSGALLFEQLRLIFYTERESFFIVGAVYELTDKYTKKDYPELNRKQRKALESERLAGISSFSQSVKYADLIDNTSSILAHDPKFAEIYLEEKRDILRQMTAGNKELYKRAIEQISPTPSDH